MNLEHALGSRLAESIRQQQQHAAWELATRLAEEARREEERRRIAGFWHQVGHVSIERVRTVVEQLDPVRYEVWMTQDDERTCPICGQLDGQVWVAGEGFVPPVHDNCRCTRAYHHVEFRRRYIEQWREVAVSRTSWEWIRTT